MTITKEDLEKAIVEVSMEVLKEQREEIIRRAKELLEKTKGKDAALP